MYYSLNTSYKNEMTEVRNIDMNSYARREHFQYFKNMAYPYVGVTVNMDITEFLVGIKERSQPFFLTFLYYIANAANAVPELRQRIQENEIVEYSWCSTSHTVARENDTYSYCSLDSRMPLLEFLPYAKEKQEESRREGTIKEGEKSESLLFVSTTPWYSYTSLIQPVPSPADSNPRITWGKYLEQDGKILIPVSLLCHHALVDGLHIARFYEKLKQFLMNEYK